MCCRMELVAVANTLYCSAKQFLSIFLMGGLTMLTIWLFIDLIIIAEEASKFRPLTERAANAAAVRAQSLFLVLPI